MQHYFFILSEDNYKYYSEHSHSELFHNVQSYSKYIDVKKEIDKLREMYPEKKLKIYAIFTTLSELDE